MANPAPGLILSISRRTDIPAFYTPWLMKRFEQGHVLARNPFNPGQARRVDLDLARLSGIVFWSRNPAPLLPHLDAFAGLPWYIHQTVTGYGRGLEPAVPCPETARAVMERIASRWGRQRLVWRYDPVIMGGAFTARWHRENFARLCSMLAPYCRGVYVSFLAFYRKTRRNMAHLAPQDPDLVQKRALLVDLSQIAAGNGLDLSICAGSDELLLPGLKRGRCVDAAILQEMRFSAGRQEALPGLPAITAKRDAGQRKLCGCHKSVDIGAYNSCGHGCLYCYANESQALAMRRLRAHDPDAPFLGQDAGT